MRIVTIEQAQTDLACLVEQAHRGEEIVIARSGVPLVRLEPVRTSVPRRQRGSLQGEVFVPDAFFDPLPVEETGFKTLITDRGCHEHS